MRATTQNMMNMVRDTFHTIGDRGSDMARSFGSGSADFARNFGSGTADLARSVGSGTADLARRMGRGTVDIAEQIGPRRAMIGLAVAAVAIGGTILVMRYLRSRRANASATMDYDREDLANGRIIPSTEADRGLGNARSPV